MRPAERAPVADGPPGGPTDGTADVAVLAVAVADRLRATGVPVPVSAVVDFAAALGIVDVTDPAAVHWAARATLVRRPEDLPALHAALTRARTARAGTLDPRSLEPGAAPGPDPAPWNDGGGGARAARLEVLRHRDLADCSPEERAEIARAVTRLRRHRPTRRSARRRPLPPGAPLRGALDGPRTLRATAAAGDLRPVVRRRRVVPRRVVLLVDVSGSMDAYAETLLRFAHATLRSRPHAEAFTLGTRLTGVTRSLAASDPDRALSAALAEVPDRAGGTRLGATLGEFNRHPGAATTRGAVVVLFSDGWERGDPAALADEVALLARRCRRLVWVNPLRGTPGYEPLARGMAAALPFVDDFVPGHSLAALEDLADLLDARRSPGPRP